MAEPFIGEMKMWGLNFAPKDWAFCNGQQMQINENSPLFTLIGVAFGGNGTSTFNLPDMRGRVPIHTGSDGMNSYYERGSYGGLERVTLSSDQIGPHTHELLATRSIANENTIGKDATNVFAASSGAPGYRDATNLVTLNPGTITAVGGGNSHNNMQPTIAITFTIALNGIYPHRN